MGPGLPTAPNQPHRTPARAAHGHIPAALAAGETDRFDFLACRDPRTLEAAQRQLAVPELLVAHGDATQLQAFHVLRVAAAADGELRAAAADVDDQPPFGAARQRLRDAGIDETRFFLAGNDLDRMTDGLAGALEERAIALEPAQCAGADDVHAIGAHVQQPLAEAFQARDRARRYFGIEAAVLVDAVPQPDHLA